MSLHPSNPNFISENAERSFPFEMSKDISDIVPNDCFLDIKGFSRSPLNGKVKLSLITKWTIGTIKPSVPAQYSNLVSQGHIQFFFVFPSTPNDLILSVDIPISTSDYPHRVTSSMSDDAGTKFLYMSSIVGESCQSIIQSSSGFIQLNDAFLEPSVISKLYKRSIDQLKIKHRNGSVEFVKGDVIMINGRNCSVSQSSNTILFNALVGLGTGRGIYQGDEANEKCDGISSINGVLPSDSGVFKLEGGNGVIIENYPEQHKIVISIQKNSRVLKCNTEEAP
jgi:hypothetical protein